MPSISDKTPMPVPRKLAYVVSSAAKAQEVYADYKTRYGEVPQAEADAVVVLGGDGTMLRALHAGLEQESPVPVFGINCGTLGFLLNPFVDTDLPQRIAEARRLKLRPLRMIATDIHDKKHKFSAFNEVTLFRRHRNPISVRILVNGEEQLDALICDGVLVATPAGSSAYNYSAHGPIVPMDSKLLAVTPISPFRPRRWRGALLPHRAKIAFEVNDPVRHETNATADFHEVESVKALSVVEDRKTFVPLLFDPDAHLSERILREQFSF